MRVWFSSRLKANLKRIDGIFNMRRAGKFLKTLSPAKMLWENDDDDDYHKKLGFIDRCNEGSL